MDPERKPGRGRGRGRGSGRGRGRGGKNVARERENVAESSDTEPHGQALPQEVIDSFDGEPPEFDVEQSSEDDGPGNEKEDGDGKMKLGQKQKPAPSRPCGRPRKHPRT